MVANLSKFPVRAYDQPKERHVFLYRELGLQCTGDLNAAKSTPKTALVGGVKFYRSKNGNLFRSGIIKAHRYGRPPTEIDMSVMHGRYSADFFNTRRTGVVKKINEPCKAFTTTGIFFLSRTFSLHSYVEEEIGVSANISSSRFLF
jgi:hypothetical protein